MNLQQKIRVHSNQPKFQFSARKLRKTVQLFNLIIRTLKLPKKEAGRFSSCRVLTGKPGTRGETVKLIQNSL